MINKVGKLIKFGSLLYNMNVIKSSKSEERKNKALEYIQNLVDEEAGLFLKITQSFSSQNNYNFTKQQIEISEIKNILLKELGTNYVRIINLSESGVCASLSQVHYAQIIDDKSQIFPIALKIKLPWIEKELEKQLSSLGLIPGIGPVKKWGIDLEEYKKSLNETISKELDYGLEIKNILALQTHKNELESHNILIPAIFPDICTPNVIVMENLTGSSMENILANWSEGDRQALGDLIAKTFCFLVFKANIYQSDFNIGNFVYMNNHNKINLGLIDFGSYRLIKKDQSDSLLYLIRNLSGLNENQTITSLANIGFELEKLNYLKEEIIALCSCVFKPFLNDEDFNFSDFKMSESVEQILGDKKWWFRSAGTPETFYLVRSYAGFLKLMANLGVKINLNKILKNILVKETSSIRDDKLSSATNLEIENDITANLLAKKLLISVYDLSKSEDLVNMTLPINAILDLEDIVDEKYLRILLHQGLNLPEIIANFISAGGPPGNLVEINYENRFINISTK